MRTGIKISFLVATVVLGLTVTVARSQDNSSTATQPAAEQQAQQRPELLKQLGLTPDQIQQIKKLNMERKPQMEAAQKRVREATDSLDQAIYADEVDEQTVAARLKDVQLAHADVQRLRFNNELAVRRILTPDQLQRFREMRRQFAEARQQQNKLKNAGGNQGRGRGFARPGKLRGGNANQNMKQPEHP